MSFVTYNVLEGDNLPPVAPAVLYQYWLTGSGIYLRAWRAGIEVFMPVAKGEVRGLARLEPYLKMEYPPIGNDLLERAVELSRQAKDWLGRPVEKLFHFSWDTGQSQWRLEIPAQIQSSCRVRPLESGPGSSYERAILELHSHNLMPAFFSQTDNRDESRSFRLFAVIGRLFDEQPQIRVRVGVFGHFWEIPASRVFFKPDWLSDCVTEDSVCKQEGDEMYGDQPVEPA